MGFWAVKEEEAHACYAEADSQMDNLDSNNNDLDFCAEQEGKDGHLDWLDIEGEGWYTEDAACSHPNHTEPLMGNVEHSSDDEWEAFCTKTWGRRGCCATCAHHHQHPRATLGTG